MAKKIEPLLTVNDLDLMPDDGNRYEIIEGELFVSRAPSLTHQRIAGNLFADIKIYLRQNPIGEVFTTPGVIFTDFNGVIPDIVYLSNETRDKIASGEKVMGAPEIVIEILSPGLENIKRDRDIKRQLYGKYKVKEYWIIDSENKTVEIYILKDHILELNTLLTDKDLITTPILPGFSCNISDIFKI